MVAQARAAGARTSDFELLTRVLATLGGATLGRDADRAIAEVE